ncbi:cold shock domain-containing protein [Saccharibacter sp. 17.LH.SD]|uniref:cold-shock protein n=1 Tax=Saccharibacter sp. 17.LH.SD TaxID=2689393 RepID=UPI0013711D0B|nr:cold-shock protein [Saccharibacter sp. 17.LH.SD]MXV44225.1 cold shock domain-containing protein [Saccharibacter sp. 17.LH.SD]
MRNNRTDRSSFSSRRGGGGFDRDFMSQPSYYDDRNSGGYNAPRSSGGGGFGGGAPRRSSGGRGGPQVTPTGPEVGATVKWFNTERGFGFVGLSDGSGDIFLHANTLNDAGYADPAPGTTLVVRIGQGPKGRQVAEIVSLDASTAETMPAPRAPRPAQQPRFSAAPDMSSAEDVRGIVKWYNGTKGFGFITPDDGGKDIFVHASALGRSGIETLADGQAIGMKVIQGRKGPEAVEVTTD